MKLGVFVTLNGQIGEEFKKLKEHGFSTCQLGSWQPEQMPLSLM